MLPIIIIIFLLFSSMTFVSCVSFLVNSRCSTGLTEMAPVFLIFLLLAYLPSSEGKSIGRFSYCLFLHTVFHLICKYLTQHCVLEIQLRHNNRCEISLKPLELSLSHGITPDKETCPLQHFLQMPMLLRKSCVFPSNLKSKITLIH